MIGRPIHLTALYLYHEYNMHICASSAPVCYEKGSSVWLLVVGGAKKLAVVVTVNNIIFLNDKTIL